MESMVGRVSDSISVVGRAGASSVSCQHLHDCIALMHCRTSWLFSKDIGGVVIVYYCASKTQSCNQALPTPALLRWGRCADEPPGGQRGTWGGAQCALAGN
jgi:hypothetical protein